MILSKLERQRLEDIKKLNLFYSQKKEKLRNKLGELSDYCFDVIVNVKITHNGIRYAKRKAIFINDLNENFKLNKKRKREKKQKWKTG